MKKYLYTLLLCAWAVLAYAQDPAYPPSPAPPGNITAAEYFIDADPGAGQGIPIPVTPAGNISNVNVAVNVNGLSIGIHRLHIRVRNAEGSWSIVQVKDFLYNQEFVYTAPPAAPQQVTAAEYFIDTDPGMGNGTTIPITPGLDLSNVSAAVNINGLANGIHRIYIRTRNAEGRWSIAQVKDFMVDMDPVYPGIPVAPQNIIAAEYFFDTDPGTGNGTPIPVTPGIDPGNMSVDANTNGLSTGTHRLYLRTKNQEGSWSITQVREFVVNADANYPPAPPVPQNIIAAEYFIDTDPGAGNGTAIAITPGIDIGNITVNANTSGLPLGIHRLYLRTKNQEGSWSITQVSEFNVSSDFSYPPAPPAPLNVVAAEYYIDEDPGIGKGTPIAITPGIDLNNMATAINTAGLRDTVHTLFIRTRNQEGSWSTTNSTKFYVGTLVPSWTIEPAGGHDYGNVAVNSTAGFNFTIRNTGDADIVFSEVILSNPAFTTTFTPGAIIPARGTTILPVTFKPAAAGPYSAELKIRSATAEVDSVITVIRGSGYTPGTPPVLAWTAEEPYNGTTGVNPAIGQPGLYTYKILYKSANNKAPQAGHPRVGIDLNGDQDFEDIGEGIYNMVKEGAGNDYATGVVYTYTANIENTGSTLGYKFFATDENGHSGTSAYKTGPTVTLDQTDLRIFANDITFSKNNPAPGEVFTVTAKVTNNSGLPATNVPVKFYQDTIPIGTGTIPAVGAFSTSTITYTLSFAHDGFFPIKVWIDSSNTLGDINVLNNYAIRPVIVGAPQLPGGINVTTAVTVQQCPQLKVLVSGRATYFGTDTDEKVAGAEVTINTGTIVIHTTTDANGNYSYFLPAGSCGPNFTYTVSVTDFTFTSPTVTKTQAIPCTSTTSCYPPPAQGGIMVITKKNPCDNIAGRTTTARIVFKFRESDPNNMWRGNDKIQDINIKVYKDDVLVEERNPADNTYAPGNEISADVPISLASTDPVVIRAELKYTYVEFLQIPGPNYYGRWTRIEVSGSNTIYPDAAIPDLTVRDFRQTKFTSFSFQDANIKCGDAGVHTVKVYDTAPNGTTTLVYTTTVNSLAGGTGVTLGFSKPDMAPGTHTLKIVTDEDNTVNEHSEGNNVLEVTVNIPKPDLAITEIQPSTSALVAGTAVTFKATVKNTGRGAGSFNVAFTIGGVTLGAKKIVGSIGEDATLQVISDPYTVTTGVADCGVVVRAVADVDDDVDESAESNNSRQIVLGADLTGHQMPSAEGSSNRPAVVRVNTSNLFVAHVRNIGRRDVENVTVRFTLNGQTIGRGLLPKLKVGDIYAAQSSFTYTFTTPGNYVVNVEADTAQEICEILEDNNIGTFHIRVVDTKQDLEVLSQYISPSSLNPAPGQNITLVGTVKNIGGKPSQANVLRFLVDNVQLGSDVPINSLQPGKDTTVEATATYSSIITGVKVMKIVVDPANAADEERENNNEATRTMIVGDAPDMAGNGGITFNPNGFRAGDSVTIFYPIRNKGTQAGTAWVRFLIIDDSGMITGYDSVQVTLNGGSTTIVSRKMLFSVEKGKVAIEVVNSSPVEFDLTNNSAVLEFSTVVSLTANTVVNGNLDMKNGLPGQLPGWIGGKLVLGDHDLVVNGHINQVDAGHYIITNGTGKLKIVNNDAVNLFPVGTSESSSNFVKIANAGTPDHFAVGVLPYVLKHGNSGDTIRSGFVDRTWFIEEQTPGGSNAAVTFYWNAGDELPGFDRDQSRTAHYTTSWELGDIGIPDIDSIGRYRKLQAGFTGFSPFAIASGTAILPVRLLQFDVVLKDNAAELKWQSDGEVNSKHFVILHSTDGQRFEEIGIVAANNRPGIHNYRFTHPALQAGTHYYRLKMVDINETFSLSAIKWVRLSNKENMRVYPNPAQRNITVTGLEANGTVRILTMDGRLVKQLRTEGNTLHTDVSSLPQGAYILQYENQGSQQRLTLIKQ